LKRQQQSWTVQAQTQSGGEMDGHCARVVRYDNPFGGGCKFEHFRIEESFEVSLVRALKIDRGLASADTLNDRVIQIGIRKEADAHCPVFRNSSFAR
jgi:hypothetical protein